MKVAIVGFNTEGQSSYAYYLAQGHEIEIRDQSTDLSLPEGASSLLGDNYLDGLEEFDLIVRTAGLPPSKISAQNPGIESKLTSQINEFLRVSPTQNIIGVTGTKGKGTTSSLITKLLEATGRKVWLGGNIGTPPLSFLAELSPDSWVVLELSSFQLTDLTAKAPHIAVCLMVMPDHLDWHDDLDDYIKAKTRLFDHQEAEDMAIFMADNSTSRQIASASPGQKIPYFAPPGALIEKGQIRIDGQTICSVEELKLPGEHNWQNVCAAITATWQVSQDVAALRKAVTSFAGLPHRLELVREIDGIRFYNDSYASNLHATEVAIQAISGQKIMIVGGYDRMLDLDHFASFVKEHAASLRKLLVIGQSCQRLVDSLNKAGFNDYEIMEKDTSIEAIVKKAQSLAQSGDAVVLSPGFASFDMFKNFSERGDSYRKAVQNL